MEKVIKLYTYNGDGVASTPFPNEEEQVVTSDFEYNANRMGSARSISAKIMHRLCLDDLWSDNVYAEFNGERFFVMNTPSSNKDNDDERYEHDITFLSEMEVLNHVYFIDAVQGDSTVDIYKSNSTKVIFMGDINEFASRLNSSLSYSKVGYNVVVDEGIVTEAKLVSFEDKYIMSALQEIFNIYEVPYYFVGKTIHIGYTDNAIPNVFRYGFEDALLSISKNNANYEVVRRCTGIGSSDNIPYYYPNESDDREAIESSGKKWITPSQNLMPPIYRETEGAERFYNAENNKYESPEGGYYEFENLYSTRTPNEKIVSFEDIKPSIVGMTNASGQRIDQFIGIAFDLNDNDEVDEDGNYIHPYFFVKLPKYNGSFGFNLFDHASEQGAMTISMTNGVCGACNFEIGVGEETQKNIVQVDEYGNLKRDQEGNVLWENQVPQDRQNDTQNYEVWIALKKDDTTYGQIMPNASQNLRPSVGDTFVILNINLPQSYILSAEEKLKDSIIKYMFLNNNERFTFSVNFSRIYFAENPDVLAMMNENARILIEYNGKQHTLYISSFSYKMSSDSLLPEISVELTDELAVGQNSLQNALDQVKNDILSSISGGDFLKQGLKYFLRKDVADTAKGKITFNKGLESKGDVVIGEKGFAGGLTGFGAKIDKKGYGEMRGLRLWEFLEVPELRYNRVEIFLGIKWRVPGAGIILSCTPDTDSEGNQLTTGTCTLKLEEGEFGAVSKDDIALGIFHFGDERDAAEDSDDSKGNFKFSGFATTYFRVTEVSGDNNETFRYALRPGYTIHPQPQMNFSCYGNFTDEARQSSAYETRTYTRLLWKQNDWEFTVGNIAMQYGDLTNLNIFGLNMSGYSMYLNSVYFTGTINQVRPDGTPVLVANEKGAWKNDTHYDFYDRVSHKGCIWLCVNEEGTITEPSESNPNWLLEVSKGEDGRTSYFHIKYSNNPDGNPMTETPSTYIGTYVDFEEQDSSDYKKYKWARFEGLQGEKGIPGENGEDGLTYYLHIKYSNDGGSTFTGNNGEDTGDYIGVYTDTNENDSSDPSKYKWSKTKGDGYTTLGKWHSDMVVPKLGVVTMAGSSFAAKIATTNPPLWCWTDNMGNRFIFSDGGYVLTGEQNTSDYELLASKGEDGTNGAYTEEIYTRTTIYSTPSTPTSPQRDEYVPSGWTRTQSGISSSYPYEWVSKRRKSSDGVWGLFSTPVVCAQLGEKGVDGLQGCVIRDSEWALNTEYRNDSDVKDGSLPVRYIDVALVRNNAMETGWDAYQCLKTHVSSSSITYANTEYWKKFGANVGSIFTSLIIAKNAKIQLFQGNDLLIQKNDGTVTAGMTGSNSGSLVRIFAGSTYENRASAPFRVTESGELYATKAHIQGEIVATSGKFENGTISNCVFNSLKSSDNSFVYDSNGLTISAELSITSYGYTLKMEREFADFIIQNGSGQTLVRLAAFSDIPTIASPVLSLSHPTSGNDANIDVTSIYLGNPNGEQVGLTPTSFRFRSNGKNYDGKTTDISIYDSNGNGTRLYFYNGILYDRKSI